MASTTPATPTEWHKSNYLISTAPSLLNPATINEAFASPQLYWAKPLPEDLLLKMLDKSLCFGVYELPNSTSPNPKPQQIGLARLITDEVTFAWLTDVYILPAHQGKGLGKWLVACVDEVLSSWPNLRRTMLATTGEVGEEFYGRGLRMRPFVQGEGDKGLRVLNRIGGGSPWV